MWLSRAGVIEQADSVASPPTISAAIVASGTPNTLTITTSQNCNFATTTGITIGTNSADALSITGISGSNTTGSITLNRNVVGTEVLKLTFAATNGVTSQASGLPIEAGLYGVTNNAPVPPTITAATIGSGTPNSISLTTSENCNFTSTTGIGVSTDGATGISVTAVSGSDTTGTVTLSRNALGGETINIVFAATNGITSQTTGLSIASGSVGVTNNADPASTPQFSNFVWSSAAAGASVTSNSDGNGAVFGNQSSGLAVQFPNWVGYGAAGSAVTDTSIKILASGFETGHTAGNALTGLTCFLVNNSTGGAEGEGFANSGVPYFTGEANGLVVGLDTLTTSITTNTTDATDQEYTITSAEFNTSGAGTGAKITLKISGNTVTRADVTISGTGYAENDTITIPTSIIGGTTAVVITLGGGDVQSPSSRIVDIDTSTLGLRGVGLPAVSGKGAVEFDLLALISAALGTTTTLEYTDAVPASNVTGSGEMGSQISSFFIRVRIDGVDDAGLPWAQELDVRTSEQNPYPIGSGGNLSGPITATPQMTSIFLHEANNPSNIIGQVATAANGWDLGNIPSTLWSVAGGATYDSAQLRAVFQSNSYVYNNPVSAEVFGVGANAYFSFNGVGLTFANGNIQFGDGSLTVEMSSDSIPIGAPFYNISPGPAETTPPQPYFPYEELVSPAAIDGGFSVIISNLIGGDDPLFTPRSLDGSPPGNYPIVLNITDNGTPRGITPFAYKYQLGGDNTSDSSLSLPTSITGVYQVV